MNGLYIWGLVRGAFEKSKDALVEFGQWVIYAIIIAYPEPQPNKVKNLETLSSWIKKLIGWDDKSYPQEKIDFLVTASIEKILEEKKLQLNEISSLHKEGSRLLNEARNLIEKINHDYEIFKTDKKFEISSLDEIKKLQHDLKELQQKIADIITSQQPEKESQNQEESSTFSEILKKLGERISDLEKSSELSQKELIKKYECFWKEACKNLEFFPTQEEFNFSKNSYFKYNPSGCDVEGMEKQIYAHIQNIKKTTEQKNTPPRLEHKEDNGSSTVGERLEARNGSIPPIDPFCMEIPTPTEAEKSKKKEEKDEIEESEITQLEDSSSIDTQKKNSPPPVEEEEKREEEETESESSKTAASEKEERAQKKEQDKKKEEKKKENQEKKKEGGRKRKK